MITGANVDAEYDAVSVQEIKQQLKTEQKMVTNMARELDYLKSRQDRYGVETKDAAVQFSYLTTISGN